MALRAAKLLAPAAVAAPLLALETARRNDPSAASFRPGNALRALEAMRASTARAACEAEQTKPSLIEQVGLDRVLALDSRIIR